MAVRRFALCIVLSPFTLFAAQEEKCARTNVNVRAAPFTSAVISGTIAAGECVKIVKQQGAWYQVEGNGGAGFVFAALLDGQDRQSDTSAREDRRTETPLRTWQQATVGAPRSPKAIKSIIDSHENDLLYLYRKRLRNGIGFEGKIETEIRIRPDGTVRKVLVLRSTLKDKQFERTVIQQILTWKFQPAAPATGEICIRYPFEFNLEK